MRKFLTAAAIIMTCSLAQNGYSYDLASRVHEFTLKNGMKWLVVRRPEAPVFAGVIMMRVGGSDESEGKTGIAHMFEHMAFKGSERLGTEDFKKESEILDRIEKLGERREELERSKKRNSSEVREISEEMKRLEKEADRYRKKNEIWEVMMRNGAHGLNAYTAKDVTTFFTSMPSNRLELWAEVFADMVFEPIYREFYIERDVVVDERRSLTENNPDRELGERILRAAFKTGPYHWSTIGYMDDIESLTIADAKEFHDKYYVASNMVGVLVGDISVGKAKSVANRVFGKYPKRPVPPSPTSGGEPNRGVVKTFKFDAEPSVAIAYHKPTLPDKDEYIFDVITSLLCEGRSSRIKRDLVFKRRMIQDVYCSDGYPGSRLDNLFLLWIDPMKGQPLCGVVEAVEDEVLRLSHEPVEKSEIERVQKQVTAGLLFSLDDNMALASELARFQTIFGDWRILTSYPEKISDVTQDDIKRVANEYLKPQDRIVIQRQR